MMTKVPCRRSRMRELSDNRLFPQSPDDADRGPSPGSSGDGHHGLARRRVAVHQGGQQHPGEDWLVEEAPVELRYNGEAFAVMMATPADLEDFAYGFSLSEALVEQAGDIRDVSVAERLEGYVLDIVADTTRRADESASRSLPGRSGCGLCGSRRLEDVMHMPPPVADGPVLDAGALERALAELGQRQPINVSSGAAHAAAWATPAGDIQCVREDVGRHNALDKLLGALVRNGINPHDGFVLVTSRASYELVIKCARLGVGLLAAISAPTALAVELARSSRMSLVGFARPGRHVLYCHPERLGDRRD